MKTILGSSIIIALLLTGTMASGIDGSIQQDELSSLTEKTVFIEYSTTTWCPQCPDASNALYELFLSEQYPFLYVSLVSDVNGNAQERSRDFNTVAIPTIYIDGGEILFVGNTESYDSLKDTYADLIMEQKNQPNRRDITIETTAQWLGNAQIAINATVTNNENRPYMGRIRTYVNEVASRWLDEQGNPYHYAMLDFALNERLVISKQTSVTFSIIWDGMEDHNGLTFEDITKENIVITSAVFHWFSHPRLGYVGFPYIQFFFAHYIDAVDMTECN